MVLKQKFMYKMLRSGRLYIYIHFKTLSSRSNGPHCKPWKNHLYIQRWRQKRYNLCSSKLGDEDVGGDTSPK